MQRPCSLVRGSRRRGGGRTLHAARAALRQRAERARRRGPKAHARGARRTATAAARTARREAVRSMRLRTARVAPAARR
eukprot:5027456-Prymnesium_polylepis.1